MAKLMVIEMVSNLVILRKLLGLFCFGQLLSHFGYMLHSCDYQWRNVDILKREVEKVDCAIVFTNSRHNIVLTRLVMI